MGRGVCHAEMISGEYLLEKGGVRSSERGARISREFCGCAFQTGSHAEANRHDAKVVKIHCFAQDFEITWERQLVQNVDLNLAIVKSTGKASGTGVAASCGPLQTQLSGFVRQESN